MNWFNKKAAPNMRITLNPTERKIFDLLLSINQKYNLGLTFRVAGGWVRDKALGKESDDIDIALDKMTGAQFGKYLTKEIGKQGNVIKANPEQSKHLETMTINLFGQDIDFVNLRSERYDTSSRIPTMQIGTPQEDAERRDLTINSLFYNINNGQVEDFTGKGVQDLHTMTLRTPMEPVKTFMDDPLRILRMLRFLSRYKGATVDPAAIQAMQQPDVQQALKQKVSSERVLTEWMKMFAGQQQTAALRILHDTGLWQTLFGEHLKGTKPFTMDQKNRWHVDNVFEHTLKVVEGYDAILRADGAGDEERAKALCAAFFHDLGKLCPEIIGVKDHVAREVYNMEYEGGPPVGDEGLTNSYHGHEDESARISRAILEGLKASNEDVQYISTICQYHMQPHDDMSDKQLRKMVREMGRSIVRRIIQHAKADATSKPGGDVAHYDSLLDRANNIEQLENKKPVLDGQTLMQMFPTLNPASGFMRDINLRLQDMMDANPAMTREQYMQAVEQMRPQVMQQFQGYQKAPKKWVDKAKQQAPLPPAT